MKLFSIDKSSGSCFHANHAERMNERDKEIEEGLVFLLRRRMAVDFPRVEAGTTDAILGKQLPVENK